MYYLSITNVPLYPNLFLFPVFFIRKNILTLLHVFIDTVFSPSLRYIHPSNLLINTGLLSPGSLLTHTYTHLRLGSDEDLYVEFPIQPVIRRNFPSGFKYTSMNVNTQTHVF